MAKHFKDKEEINIGKLKKEISAEMNELRGHISYDRYNKTFDFYIVNDYVKPFIIRFLETKKYPLDFKECIYDLLLMTDTSNLFLFRKNLMNLKLVRKRKSGIALFGGNTYNVHSGKLIYNDKISLAMELLRMSSSCEKVDDFEDFNNVHVVCSGFAKTHNKKTHFKGLDDGYTELLCRRKFFDEDYDTDGYKINLYLLRLIELLFDKKELESAYFNNNPEFIYKRFMEFQALDEFFSLLTYLELFSQIFPPIYDVNKALSLAQNMVKETGDDYKIYKSEVIIEEYFKDNPNHRIKKLY